MVSRRKSVDEGNTVDSAKHPVADEVNICPQDLKKIMTSEGALGRPFLIGDFVSVKKRNVQIRGYVDFYGGYANHCREIILGLDQTGMYNIRLVPIPSPVDIHPDLWNKMNWYIHNPAYREENSDFLVIAGPGHLQKQFLPENRRIIGWTMIETLGVQKQIVGWCNNADLILCPTDIDYRRFCLGGVKKNKLKIVPIGYDEKVFHKDVIPLDIINLRSRYVFGFVGSWNHRKGVEEIVTAFVRTFNCDEPVSLMLVCKYGNRPYGENAENREEWGIRTELKRCLDGIGIPESRMPHITVVDVPLHPPVIPHLYSRIDCLVGFSMGESTWLPGLEVGAMHKPIIQLNNPACGYMDYLYGARYLCQERDVVKCDEKMYGGTSEYYEGEEMCVGNVDELGDKMRMAYAERGTKVQQEEIETTAKAISVRTWDNSIRKLVEVL